MPGKHSAKQKRQAKHVADSERKRGKSPEEAERIGWAAVNARKAATEYGSNMTSTAVVASPPPPPPPPPPATKSEKKVKMRKDLDAGEAYAAVGKAGPSPYEGRAGEAMNYVAKLRAARRRMHGAQKPTTHQRKHMPAKMTSPKQFGKAIKVLTLDEFLATRKALPGNSPGGVSAPAAPAAPKKFPRRQKPTVKMKPIIDEEAMANLRAGKYIEKHVAVKALTAFLMKKGYNEATSHAAAKALMAGYGKVSGGGALRAPNRGYDLERAMEAMPKPAGPVGPPRVYLPGVHNPTSPMRPKKRTAAKKKALTNESAAKVNEEGGAMEMSFEDHPLKKALDVVHKSEGEPTTMAKTNFNDLFKAELGAGTEEALCNCPHCEQPITKSDLEKAHGGKGSKTHMSGAAKGKSSAHVRDQNPEGGVTRGGDGHGVISPSRGVPGASKTDVVAGVQNSKGSKAHKAMDNDDSSSDDGSVDKGQPQSPSMNSMSKAEQQPVKKSITIRGTEFVQWVDDGSDAALAKSIAEGALGGTPPTQPLDLNNDLTRLLT